MSNILNILAVYEDNEVNLGSSLLISLVSILIVFLILVIIILVSGVFSKTINAIMAKNNILPSEANKILAEDEDAVAAALVATIDFYNSEKKDAKLVSIERID